MTENTTSNYISLFPSAMAKEPSEAMTVDEFLNSVKTGRWQHPVEVLRRHIAKGDRSRYDHKKRTLPAVTLSCHCLSRELALGEEGKAVTHSGWLQADFDGKDNSLLVDEGVCAKVREALAASPYVGGVFVGPSGQGVKAIVRIDGERHRDSWFAAEKYFRTEFSLTLDKATKDQMRLCFVSYDPDMIICQGEAEVLPLPEEAGTAEPSNENWHPPMETTASDIAEMLTFVPSRPDYETWLKVASAVWSVLPMAEGCQVLNSWSPEEHPGEYTSKHKARLEQISIGTLVHIAAQHGFDAREAWRRKRWVGRIRFADSDKSAAELEDPAADTAPKEIATELSRNRIVEAFQAGQAGDAKLWCELRRGLRIFNIHSKVWMTYADGVWTRDSGGSTPWDICDTLREIYHSLADSVVREIKSNPAPDNTKDPRVKEVAGIEARCAALVKWDYVSAVEKFAQRAMCCPATAFDRDPDILVLQNGTLDFAEGIFREHRQSDLATIRSPIAFDPTATCPKWQGFLERCIPDPDTREYLARAVGYSLTGRVEHDVLFFCYGKGANGKSTFFKLVQGLLGDLMTTVPIAALLAAKSDNNFDYQKAAMEGKRIVLTDEIPENRTLADSQVKAIVGGDNINARRPYELPYTFAPTHKLWLMGNHKPDVKGTDEGIWRRVHMIPFIVTIPQNERRDRAEIMMEFNKEISGILNWAIRGLLECRDIGLNPPDQVMEATKAYREESDQFGTFLTECTELATAIMTPINTLGRTYAAWCESNQEKPRYQGTRQVKKVLIERGWHIQVDRKNHPCVVGMAIKTAEEDQQVKFS